MTTTQLQTADCRLPIDGLPIADCRLTDWRLAIDDFIDDWRLGIGNRQAATSDGCSAIDNPPIGNPSIGNPSIGNPSIGNPSIGNRQSAIRQSAICSLQSAVGQ